MTSPMQRHARSASAAVGSASGKKLLHSKAAAQRLANVMAAVDDSDEEDDFVLESAPSIGIGGRGRAARPSSPMAMVTSCSFSIFLSMFSLHMSLNHS